MRTLSPRRQSPPRRVVLTAERRTQRGARAGQRDPLAPQTVNVVRWHGSQCGDEHDASSEVERLLRREIDTLTGLIAGRSPADAAADTAAGLAAAGSAVPPDWTPPPERAASERARRTPKDHSPSARGGHVRVAAATAPPGLASCAEVLRSPPRMGGPAPSPLRGCRVTHAAPQHPLRLRRTPQCTPPLRRLLVPAPKLQPLAAPRPPSPAPQQPSLWPPPPPSPALRHSQRSSSVTGRAAALRSAPAAPTPRRTSRRSLSAPPSLDVGTVELKVNMAALLRGWVESHDRDGLSAAAADRFPARAADGVAAPSRTAQHGSKAADQSFLLALMEQSREMKRQLDRHQQLTRRAADAARQREEARQRLAERGCRRVRDKLMALKYHSDRSGEETS
eukprot:TRINITY_DN15754_c0_g1_i1.p1 TRINITY_DN15754_c0_g1~~TRINITY_DN15754_c0_g1_i1.p1  ORF type:complete len:412 (+),score=132.63 TRINITY_DN15754_c0_g1_i1:59-1237(+)